MNLTNNFPAHVGIIMDGNGRWATRRGYPRIVGHRKGVDAVERTINYAKTFGIKYLTFFAFSTENWKRDKTEIEGIFNIVREYLKQNRANYKAKDIKIVAMGDTSKIPKDLQDELTNIIEQTKDCKSLTVNFAINYGGRDEIVRAFNLMQLDGKINITKETLPKYLYNSFLPDPDLIIRTSGEQRLSNFMLYQCAYSELYFTKVFWPSFEKKHFKKALKEYSKRERRYGGNHKK